ncbi:zinc-finger homeodomain protein 3 [Carica papaya]|uniref:zinc-finger homeodomain protein 3 n=1 Tax=Carica papaya TaxID=3649 RepID=UPI000B8CA8DA|nr:zinc-finger homeodomain protein 3 [Carica papaya]
MELSSQEGEMPMPINTTYSHGAHIIHHHHNDHHHMPNNGSPSSLQIDHYNSNNNNIKTNSKQVMVIKYKECLKNHAAAMGGNATDGCGEFMPSGEEGTIEALNCSVCNCHRNFHRKEMQGGGDSYLNRKIILGHHHKSLLPSETLGYPTGTLISSRPHQMIMSYNMGGSFTNPSDQSDHEQDQDGGILVGRAASHHHHHHQMVKKRFRTKFTQEQKEKMLNFAEKVGWKIQKQEEGVVQQFCQEIGVKRRVLKVWMHNNKHNLAKKNSSETPIDPATTTTPPTS